MKARPTNRPPANAGETSPISDETLVQQVAALPSVVWVLVAGLFINRFGTVVVPFLTLYLTDQGYKGWQIGLVFGALAVGGVGSMILGGRLTDLVGRKNTMAAGLIGGGFSMLLMWLADSLFAYSVSACLCGLTHGMYHPAANSLMIDVVPPERRVTGFAVVRWATNLGFAGGMAAAGLLAEHNYAWLFIGDAATSIAFGVIALLLLPHGVRVSRQQSQWLPALRHMLGNRPFVMFFIANFLSVSTFFLWGSVVALLVKDLNYAEKVFGYIMSANGLMIGLFEIPISQFCRPLKPRNVIAVGFLFCGLGTSLNGFATGWIMIAVAMLVFTVGEMVSMPVSGAYVAGLAPKMMRGRYSAAIGLTWNLGHATAPGLGILLYQAAPQVLWAGIFAIGIIAAGCMLIGESSQPSSDAN